MARQTRERASTNDHTSVMSSQVFLQGVLLMIRIIQNTSDFRKGRAWSIFQPRGAFLGMKKRQGKGFSLMMARVPIGTEIVTAKSKQKTLVASMQTRANKNCHLFARQRQAWGMTTAQQGQKERTRAMQYSTQRQGPRNWQSQLATCRLTSTVIRMVETKQTNAAMMSKTKGIFLMLSSYFLIYPWRWLRSALSLCLSSFSSRMTSAGTPSSSCTLFSSSSLFFSSLFDLCLSSFSFLWMISPLLCLRHSTLTSQAGLNPPLLSRILSLLASMQSSHMTMPSAQLRQYLMSLGSWRLDSRELGLLAKRHTSQMLLIGKLNLIMNDTFGAINVWCRSLQHISPKMRIQLICDHCSIYELELVLLLGPEGRGGHARGLACQCLEVVGRGIVAVGEGAVPDHFLVEDEVELSGLFVLWLVVLLLEGVQREVRLLLDLLADG